MQVFARPRPATIAAMALTIAGATLGGIVDPGLGPVAFVPAAHAQTANRVSATSSVPGETPEQRLRRMEAEIKALQRKVFPDGAGKFFTPEIAPDATVAPPAGAPVNTAVSDMLVRMDSIESQVTRLTAQIEETQNRLSKLEAHLAPAPAPVVEAPAAATPESSSIGTSAPAASAAPQSAPALAMPTRNGATISSNTAVMSGGNPRTPAAPAAKQTPTPPEDRVAAVQAIEKPQSGDRAENEYTYGYRLWEAKFYPEAQQQLLRYVEQFPRHRRMSYARNLLGRAYLDDGKPGMAAQVFVQNYQADPMGDRAPDSLLYLAVAMNRLKEPKRACVALDELNDKYPAVAKGRLAGEVARIRAGVKCN